MLVSSSGGCAASDKRNGKLARMTMHGRNLVPASRPAAIGASAQNLGLLLGLLLLTGTPAPEAMFV